MSATTLGRFIVAMWLLPLLSACSGSTKAYQEALQYAFWPKPDAELSLSQLAKRSFDSLYAKVGDLPQAVLVLAFEDANRQKWLSADQAMLMLDAGRLVKTTGFAEDVVFVANQGVDPLSKALRLIRPGDSFERVVDTKLPEHSAERQQLTISDIKPDVLTFFGHSFQVMVVTEQVLIKNKHFTNYFYFDQPSGQLLKSRQQISLHFVPIELTHIQVVFRLLQARGLHAS